ncbi:hypothetical protein ACFVKB_28590 [Rhodococcus sp. NPDC127530]
MFVTGSTSRLDTAELSTMGCDIRVVADAGHIMMNDNLDGFCAAIA